MTQPLLRPARRRTAAAAAALAIAAAGFATSASATALDDIRRQVEASQFDQAYATAQANPQLMGDVHFDFLYGVAAINVGRVPEGLLALERHLAAVPANDRARLELARGYFLLGEYTRARSEFEFVLRYNPPAGVRSNIAGFLQAMQTREAADRRATARFYAEAGIGRDSNVNGGTFRDELQLVFGNVNLVDSPSREVPDTYGQLAVGGQQQYRVSNRLSVFAGADLDLRANVKQHAYDLTSGGVNIGFSQLGGSALWRTTLALNELIVGGNRYRDTFSLSTDANITLGPDQSVTAFAQYGEMRHAVNDEVRDARATTLGAMFTQGFPDAAGAPSVGARFSYTQEDNARLRVDLSKKMPLLRLFGSLTPMDRLRLSLGVSVYRQQYGGEDVGFGTVRRDNAWAADLVANYALSPTLSLRADAVWSSTQSNQDLYDSHRSAVSLKLRYQF
jgi:tetratricopeptide (TPR) repeat protein